MEQWVRNDLYEQLLAMPLWVCSAFGSLKDSEPIPRDDVRYRLMTHLILKTIDKCPKLIYDPEWEWKTGSFIGIFKTATIHAKKVLKITGP